MGGKTILVSLSEDERAFIEREIATGNYAGEEDVLRAGLAALKQAAAFRASTKSAFGEGHATEFGFGEPDLGTYVGDGYEQLRQRLSRDESSRISDRDIPQIIQSVKAKLRANGAL